MSKSHRCVSGASPLVDYDTSLMISEAAKLFREEF